MNIIEAYKKANSTIEGWPEEVLTAALVIAAIVAILVAMFGSPLMKGVVIAWIVLP